MALFHTGKNDKDIDTLINVDIFLDHPTTTTTTTATTTTPGIVFSKNYWDVLFLPSFKLEVTRLQT